MKNFNRAGRELSCRKYDEVTLLPSYEGLSSRPKDKRLLPLQPYHIGIVLMIFNVLIAGLFVSSIYGQEAGGKEIHILRGVVVSVAEGLAIEGALITVDNQHTRTNADGKFALAVVKSKGTLIIKHIGYQEQRVAFENTSTLLNIVLQAHEKQIEEVEVVSTGYQKIPKERATGSFVQINNELFNRRVGSGVLERLDGIAPGLQFDNRTGKSKINIRGINTFNEALTGPLIVVDNFPYDGNLDNINPNDVESITLLKDAAAASIWGARAANGVIVINLKNPGKAKGFKWSASSNITIADKPDLFYHRTISSSDFIDVEEFLYDKGHYNNVFNPAVKKFYVTSPVTELLHQLENGEVDRISVDKQIDKFRNMDYRKDMLKHIYRTPIQQQYAASVSNSNELMDFMLSIGHDNNSATITNVQDKRSTLRTLFTMRPSKKLEFQTNLSIADLRSHSGGANIYPIQPGGGKTRLYPYARLIDDEGNSLPVPMNYNAPYLATAGDGLLLNWSYSPLDEINTSSSQSNSLDLSLLSRLKYKVMEGLDLEVQFSHERQNSTGDFLNSKESFYTRNLVNLYSQINGGVVKRIIPYDDILQKSIGKLVSNRVRGQMNYSKEIIPEHELTLFSGAELLNKDTDASSYQVYGYSADNLTSVAMDYLSSYPIFDALMSNNTVPNTMNFSGAVTRFVSYYGNLAYSLKRQYVLSMSARKDASNGFGMKTNMRWNPLWSIGGAWLASENPLLSDISWLNTLKLKYTYGHSGNSGGGGSVRPLLLYNNAPTSYINVPFAMILSPPNPYLKWEDVRMINHGIDFAVFGSRISGTLEYFTKKSTDLISADPIDPTTGFNIITRNVGEIKSRGFDFQVNARILEKGFRWTTAVSLSHVKDVVTKFNGTPSSANYYATTTGRSLTPLPGKVLYPVFSFPFAGLDPDNGQAQGYLNGEPSKDYRSILNDSLETLKYHGSGLPPYYGFWRNSFGWKQWSASFSMQFKFGHFFQKRTINYANLFNAWDGHQDFEKRWREPGDENHTTVPAMTYPLVGNSDTFYTNSEANIKEGDVVRLNDLRVAYTLGKRKYLPEIQFYMSVNNLGLLSVANIERIDPDFFDLPPSRRYSFGLSANF